MKLPEEVPVMILPNATLFPQAMLPLYIFEPRYRKMLHDVLHSHRMFVVAMQKPGRVHLKPSRVAGLGVVRASVKRKDGTSHLMLQGIARVELGEATKHKPYRIHRIHPIEAKPVENVHLDALMAKVRELVEELIRMGLVSSKHAGPEPFTAPAPGEAEPSALLKSLRHFARAIAHTHDPAKLADMVTSAMLPDAMSRQAILETLDVEDRLARLVRFLLAEITKRRKTSAA
ncbi:MAG: LON peptidase substrate-binding domain-containing protein [Verrucomicrobia bacterium]|nr:LON peptidase substrate-binding domain-containing protein [Verrucomicrobiota bacterium]